MGKKTVIVGGTGFIGSAITNALRTAGGTVRVVDTPARLAQATIPEGVETAVLPFPALDGMDAALAGADALIHLSCTTTPANSMDPLSQDAAQNIAPSVALFEAAGRAGVSRVVFSSSGGTVYGNPRKIPVTEDLAGNALCGYGVSKLAIENYLHLEAGQAGFTGISLRIGNPFGAYQLQGTAIGVIARYVSEALAGQDLQVWGDGSVVRDYIHIDDVVAGVCAALDTPDLPSGAYNIGSGRGYSVNEIIETIFRIMNRRVNVDYVEGRGFDVEAIVLANDKFRQATGWEPRCSLEDGIRSLLDA